MHQHKNPDNSRQERALQRTSAPLCLRYYIITETGGNFYYSLSPFHNIDHPGSLHLPLFLWSQAYFYMSGNYLIILRLIPRKEDYFGSLLWEERGRIWSLSPHLSTQLSTQKTTLLFIPFHTVEPEGASLHSASHETDFVMQPGPWAGLSRSVLAAVISYWLFYSQLAVGRLLQSREQIHRCSN